MRNTSFSFENLDQGYVHVSAPDDTISVASGPRLVVTDDGEILCSFMLQTKLASNDFVPHLARSRDGLNWSKAAPVWPELIGKNSMFCSISRAPSGELFIFGSTTPITAAGETLWNEETQGLLPNQLFWSKSSDSGHSWSEPQAFPLPIPGSAEAPAPLCITQDGRWLGVYSPYPTFDPQLKVDQGQVVAVWSNDQGATWQHNAMLRFAEEKSGAAESWAIQLQDGRILGSGWHLNLGDDSDRTNKYALSLDGGTTWTETLSTGITGQSTALTARADGKAYFIYNQRRHGEPGVRLSVVDPSPENFGVLCDELVWKAAIATQSDTDGGHSTWTDFSFGEPAVVTLPDGTLLVVLWCQQPEGTGIAFVRLKLHEAA